MEKVKINIPAAVEYYRSKFGSKQLFSCGVALDQEVLDFLNEEKLGDQFFLIARGAKKLLGKNFIVRVECDDDFIIYNFIEFETGNLLLKDQTLRGVKPLGDYEFYCFTIDLDYKVPDSKVDPENMYAKPKLVGQQGPKVFIAPPNKYSFLMGGQYA